MAPHQPILISGMFIREWQAGKQGTTLLSLGDSASPLLLPACLPFIRLGYGSGSVVHLTAGLHGFPFQP